MRSDWACDAPFPLCVPLAAACAVAVGRHISINLKIKGKWRVNAACTLSPCLTDQIMEITIRTALAVPAATSKPNLTLSTELSGLPQTQSHFGTDVAVDRSTESFVVSSSLWRDRSGLLSGSGSIVVGELAIADETQIATRRKRMRIFEEEYSCWLENLHLILRRKSSPRRNNLPLPNLIKDFITGICRSEEPCSTTHISQTANGQISLDTQTRVSIPTQAEGTKGKWISF